MSTAISYPTCPSKLSQEQTDQYWREGYLAFDSVLSPEEVAQARSAISELVRKYVATNQTRIGRFFVQFEPRYKATDPTDPELELKVRKLMWYHEQHPWFAYLVKQHPKIQGVVSSLIGENPVLFQDMALIKPPFIGSEKPWHQDDAYFTVTPLDSVCGVWIALDDAAVENGCMHVIPGGHRLGPLRHFHGPVEGSHTDCQIVEGRLDVSQAVPVELPAGGGMFFHGLTPHETPPNRSPQRRRALQFHYHSATSKAVTHDEYARVYAEADGTPASCYAAANTK